MAVRVRDLTRGGYKEEVRGYCPRRSGPAADPLLLIRYHRKLARCTDAYRPHGFFAALAYRHPLSQ